MAFEPAVEAQVNAGKAQPAVVERGRRPQRRNRLHRFHAGGIGGDAQRQPPFVGEIAVKLPVGKRRPHVVEAGPAKRGEPLERVRQRLLALAGRRLWNVPLDEGHGRAEEQPGRPAGTVADDFAPGRRRRPGIDASRRHGRRIGKARPAAFSHQP